ncbi:unnamed protein product [Brassicogethes aeneus]|uniref:protein acetyllysine N-acetyltransferase n=1 Tax=Brassicogethes aeneus TaxID=1431903 RepID=A0A9P0F8G4_BRAAE|nr:unnamed protein product [Brassicogethes aeneus]
MCFIIHSITLKKYVQTIAKISIILQKPLQERSFEETEVLKGCSVEVEEAQERLRKRTEAKRRLEEIEDPEEELRYKCQILAQAIAQSQHLVVYTGAGISTAAEIPDYRGPNGIWTRLQKGKDIGDHDLTLAKPTFTHMALSELYKRKILKYVVSQNCDGLHLRSGLPRTALSEVHGNMYIEVCKACKPHREYLRLFDVTENTARFSHKTYRKCYECNSALVDSIVHFGERGSLAWPLNWSGACKNAKSATTILCLGSSLKVLKKYPWLWQMDKPAKRRPNLYIVNLQWTPKDDCANVKIHGKCDEVMKLVMQMLGVNVAAYDEAKDPIFAHATDLDDLELHTTTQPQLKSTKMKEKSDDVKLESVDKEDKDCPKSNKDLSEPVNSPAPACDNSKSSYSNNSPARLPSAAKLTNNSSSFSIDSLLTGPAANNTILLNNLPPQQQVAPNSYLTNNFNAALLLHRQIFGGYTDFLLYPYQTSFLYPGLHSIINPVPLFREPETAAAKIEPSCAFCDGHFKSPVCLFYAKFDAKFGNKQLRYSKIECKNKPNVCVCCDYTTEEEEDVEEFNERDSKDDKDQIKSKIQAGWFGKGYKKYKRYKKKSI